MDRIIIDLGHRDKIAELEEFIEKSKIDQLIEAAVSNMCRSEGVTLWNYILIGCSGSENLKKKKFKIVLAVLEHLNVIELNLNRSFNIITRLFEDLPNFTSIELVEIVDWCLESIRAADPKCICWYYLLPEVMNLLNKMSIISANDVKMPGSEYRYNVISNLSGMKWSKGILTPIASMFTEMPITKDERISILGKLCLNMQSLSSREIGPLAFQLFTLSNTAQLIIIPIIGFQKYFHRNYYRKVYSDMASESTDLDSIDNSIDEYLEEEQTVLYHLSNVTIEKFTEKDVVAVFKMLSSIPKFILNPFMISAILTMCNVNCYPEKTRLSASLVLPFLRNIIKSNEDEKEMKLKSAWCSNTLDCDATAVDLSRIFEILIDRSKEKMELVTPGLVALSFSLLKAKHQKNLNILGSNFIQAFVKKRSIFGAGVIENLSDFLLADHDSDQYIECLTVLSQTNPLIFQDGASSIQNVFDFFLVLNGKRVMRIMNFIFPLLKIPNSTIKDSFLDILKKAIYGKEKSTCQMAVFGFCMVLKELKNNNSRRNAIGASQGTAVLSGYSLGSQLTLTNRDNPQRFFDTLTLEIIGVLTKCFNEQVEVKETLYEGLTRAVQFNPKLLPHILLFLDYHFQSYFEINENDFKIKFEKIVQEKNDFILIWDNLGKLINFMGFCVIQCEHNKIAHDNILLEELLMSLVDRIDDLSLENIGMISGHIDGRTITIACQYLNCLEACMSYAIFKTNSENPLTQRILRLFKHYSECFEEIKKLCAATKKAVFKPENIWDISTIERFLRIIHEETVPFASTEDARPLRINRDFNRHVMKVSVNYIADIRTAPEYRQVIHSFTVFNGLMQSANIIWSMFIKKLGDQSTKYDTITAQLCVEFFKQCIQTADVVYKKKIEKFLQIMTNNIATPLLKNVIDVINILQELIIKSMIETSTDEDENPFSDKKITICLFQCLEILYEYVPSSNRESEQIFNWLNHFCKNYKIENKNLGIVNKILFTQRIKTKTGEFFSTIASEISVKFGQIEKLKYIEPLTYKSITLITAESCSIHLFGVVKKQIEEIEYFIAKIKSIYCKIKIPGQGNNDEDIQRMKTIEKMICTQLIYISHVLEIFSNVKLPLGVCMDTLVRLIIQMYICLSNLTKHFILRHSTIPVSYLGTKFDQLVRTTGKPLASKLYELVSHIEEKCTNEISKTSKKKDPRADKAKLLRDTRNLPKLILRIENYNKFVIMLGKKTKNDLSNYLHIGTVRDFKINTNKLKDALQSALSQSEEIVETDSPNLDEIEHMSESEDEEPPPVQQEIIVTPELPPSTQTSVSGVVKDRHDVTEISAVLLNMNKINQKTAKKRKLKDVKEPIAKKKKRTPMKINKPILESFRRASTSSEFSGPLAMSETTNSSVVSVRRRSSRKSK